METTTQYLDDKECPLESDAAISFEEVEKLYSLQRDILEGVALGDNYIEVLNKLCQMAEEMVPNSLASIMLLDDSGLLQVLTAPSIPEVGIQALNNLQPGPNAGSCGTTVYRQSPTFVSNVLTDEKWKNMRQLAKDFGLGACWSMPVRIDEDKIIGTFALTSFQSGAPNVFQRRLLDTCAYIVGIVLQKVRSEEALAHRLRHDALTGLPNREQLREDVEMLSQQDAAFSLVICGLNRFKSINDSHGHDTGDQVLVSLAQRFGSIAASKRYSLYRVGGDEFIFLIRSGEPLDALSELEKQLETAFNEPVQYGMLSFYLSGSSGASYFNPDEPTSFYTLMKQADMAMYSSKQVNNQKLVMFEPEMSVRVEDSLALEGELREALREHQFEVYYQKIVTAQNNVVENLEALVRWNHPVKGIISPLRFIPLAEEMGIIHEITKSVLKIVLDDLDEFEQQGFADIKVSINISGKEFSQTLINDLLERINRRQRNQQIEFELTESYIMSHAEDALLILDNIRQAGVGLAIDDFGTGYSSLSYLKQFSVDKLKIDQSLIRDIPVDESDRQIARAVVALAHSLGLKVVAEGVETEQHKLALEDENIDFLQGYYFAKPQTKPQLISRLKQRREAS